MLTPYWPKINDMSPLKFSKMTAGWSMFLHLRQKKGYATNLLSKCLVEISWEFILRKTFLTHKIFSLRYMIFHSILSCSYCMLCHLTKTAQLWFWWTDYRKIYGLTAYLLTFHWCDSMEFLSIDWYSMRLFHPGYARVGDLCELGQLYMSFSYLTLKWLLIVYLHITL